MPIFETKWIDEKVPVFIWKTEESNLDPDVLSLGPRQREQWHGRQLLDYAASILGLSMSKLTKDAFGKPYFADTSWEFSLTHTKSFIAVVFHPDQPVGIDLERPQPKIEKVLPRICTPQEIEWAAKDPIKSCFLWSAKEAMYKLYGKRSVNFNENLEVASEHQGEINMPEVHLAVRFVSYTKVIPDHVLVVALLQ